MAGAWRSVAAGGWLRFLHGLWALGGILAPVPPLLLTEVAGARDRVELARGSGPGPGHPERLLRIEELLEDRHPWLTRQVEQVLP